MLSAMPVTTADRGLRQGEVFGLAVEDVHVRHQVRIVGGKLVLAPPKGGKTRDPRERDARAAALLRERAA